jgi:rSAM-associated Gly-rich repeat protein
MNPTFTNHLKTLMLGGAIALAAAQTSNAAVMPSAGESPVDVRVAKIREALDAQAPNALTPGQAAEPGDAGMMWWRNVWARGGRDWGNGWHNWHNGGWGNWHNF